MFFLDTFGLLAIFFHLLFIEMVKLFSINFDFLSLLLVQLAFSQQLDVCVRTFIKIISSVKTGWSARFRDTQIDAAYFQLLTRK